MFPSDYDKLKKRIAGYSANIQQLYLSAIDELAELYKQVDFNPDKAFHFSDYKSISQKQAEIMRHLHSNLYQEVKQGIYNEWFNSHDATDNLVRTMLGTFAGDTRFDKYFARNNDAVEAFFARSNNEGLNLSQRVWRNTSQFKEEAEMAFDLALRRGKSAAQLSRDMRKYLEEPDNLFRRVRDEHGNLHLSKRAKAYHPGQGVYRSSYMNSLRMTSTEINMSYRTADWQRWQSLDFVIGYEVKRSKTNKKKCPECDQLAGLYPKSFKFVGWHPWCRCYAVPKLMSQEEFVKVRDMILNGEDVSDYHSEDEVKDLPYNMKDLINNDTKLILAAKSKPYFIRDNFKEQAKGLVYIDSAINLKKPYELNRENLIKRGFNIDNITKAEYRDIVKGLNLEQFDDDLNKIAERYGINLNTKYISLKRDYLKIHIIGDNDFALKRTFNKNGLVEHNLFEVPVHLQGQGISRDVFRALYKQYKKAGVKTIEVFANLEVGGYTWGRYGFCASVGDAELLVKRGLRKNLINQTEYDNAMSVITKYRQRNKTASKFPMNLLAEKKYGKQLLLGSDWEGTLDLTNKKQRSIFEDYLSNRK